jgi:uncharacterized UBP type Zn finger protein
MGFPEWLVTEALIEHKTLDAAVNWCTEQMSESGSPPGESLPPSTETVNEESLATLLSMGFDMEMAKESLIKTKVRIFRSNFSQFYYQGNVDAAANWLFDHM